MRAQSKQNNNQITLRAAKAPSRQRPKRKNNRRRKKHTPFFRRMPFWALVAGATLIIVGYLVFFYRCIVTPFSFRWQAIYGDANDPDGFEVRGIDLSHYQERIDWERVRNAKVQRVPLRFAFIKATEGTSIIDENFNENFYQAKRNDIVRGAYHFFVPDVDARKQAQFFMKQVHLEAGDLPPVLDVEKSGRLNPAQLKRAVRTWLDLVEKHYGVKPILYTGYSFKMKYLSDSVFNQYPYWIAHYYVNQLPYQGKWHFWQYTDVGRIDGIEGHVDCNIFGGTLQQLHDLTIMPEEEDEIGLAAETAE